KFSGFCDFLHFFHVTTGFTAAYQFISFFNHITAAFRAFLSGRFLPGHELTFWIIFAAVILSSFFCFLQNHFFSAQRTRNSNLLVVWLCISAVRKSGACQKTAMGAIFNHHMASAFLSDDIRHLILYFYLFQFFFSLLHTP